MRLFVIGIRRCFVVLLVLGLRVWEYFQGFGFGVCFSFLFVVLYLLICILGLLSVEFGGLWCLIVALMNVGWFLGLGVKVVSLFVSIFRV